MEVTHKRLFNRKVAIALLVIATFFFGYYFGYTPPSDKEAEHEHIQSKEKEATIWTCSMHPQIRRNKPGQCPICGMNLVPLESTKESQKHDSSQDSNITISEDAQKLAEIIVEPVERKFVTKQIRMTGILDYDETRLKYVTARYEGRLDKLFVDYTGVFVQKDDHLLEIYSPDLISAQEELLQSLKLSRELPGNKTDSLKNSFYKTLESSREKLRLWGLTENQIKEIEENGKTFDHVTIFSPISGVVVEKEAIEGMYVSTGDKIYTIADLSQLWLKVDAYESDMMWLHYGQKIEFEVESYPGKTFTGRISFIEPTLNRMTRTIKLRVNVNNSQKQLKPGMFVKAIVSAKLDNEGKIIDTELSNKWICSMHPEIIKNGPGSCDICNMPLVPVERYGFSSSGSPSSPPLIIKSTAPLITGKRAIVYIKDTDKGTTTFYGREITLGPKAGNYYIVFSGLSEGELVVVNGNFKIDSALQISAKPSMMNPVGGSKPAEHHH